MNAPRLLSDLRCVWDAGARLGEGTCWSVREQSLYWVDILGQQLHRRQTGAASFTKPRNIESGSEIEPVIFQAHQS